MPKLDTLYTDFIAMPWCIKTEFTKGCNLRCSFCPVSTDRDLQMKKTWEYMEPSVLQKFCHSFNEMRQEYSPRSWPRIEIALRGEPLLNPDIFECLETIREELPKCQVTLFSNGTPLLNNPDLLNGLFSSGLNILYIDCYNNTYEKFHNHCEKHKADHVGLHDAHDFSPYRIHPNGHKRTDISLIVGLEDQENSLSIRPIHNVGGNANEESLIQLGWKKPKSLPLKKNCTRPFREIVFHLTGDIVTCCVDWYPNEKTILGNINEQTVEEIWFGENHIRALRALWKKNRDWGLCKTCDYRGGYRHGFLQDPFERKV